MRRHFVCGIVTTLCTSKASASKGRLYLNLEKGSSHAWARAKSICAIQTLSKPRNPLAA
jgi:hypothetical protein